MILSSLLQKKEKKSREPFFLFNFKIPNQFILIKTDKHKTPDHMQSDSIESGSILINGYVELFLCFLFPMTLKMISVGKEA